MDPVSYATTTGSGREFLPQRCRQRRGSGWDDGMVMSNHWWWRPGMRPGRRVDTFYVKFNGLAAACELAAAARQRLAGVPGLDLVPDEWLHLTVQEVGFSDEVTGTDLAAITAAAGEGLAALAPVT